MPLLHDSAIRSGIETRVRALRPDIRPRWGRMSVDQMLWHVNQALAAAVGEIVVPAEKPPLPVPLMKFLIIRVPWPKGAPTAAAFVAKDQHDFDAERTRCLRLLDTLSSRSIEGPWPTHFMLGEITGPEVSRLQAKHLDHHLRQFGV